MSTWFEERLGGIPLQYMHLRLAVDLPLSCQTCLQPYMESLDSDRDYILFESEEEAEAWDFDEENQDAEDALVASETFNLLDSIEDELLLSLPLSARHALGECKAEDLEKVSKKLKSGSEEIIIQKPNPFAILQKLKKQWFCARIFASFRSKNMAVQQNKKSPSKRGMHRAHDFLSAPSLAVEPTTGEAHLRHHISPNGYYRGRKVIKTKND